MFVADRQVTLFEYFRVPYVIAAAREPRIGRHSPMGELGLVALDGRAGRELWWVPTSNERMVADVPLRLGPALLFCPVHRNEIVSRWLRSLGSSWEPVIPIFDDRDVPVAAIWRSTDGDVFVPFDVDAAVTSYWSEAYAVRTSGRSAAPKRAAMHSYYAVRPLLPRSVQIAMRRAFSRVQARARFPRWPVEAALHNLYNVLLKEFARFADRPIPTIAPWPKGRGWALVLTHDVETEKGYENIHLMRSIERDLGLRSSWNFVPRRYVVADDAVRELREDGFEVGVHGLYHDGRDLESEKLLHARLPEMHEWARRWGAVGFRSPATHRDWNLMSKLGFEYDSSSPDTDPFEPQSGGCCTWWPFFNGGIVELPITLVQDHTLFVILGRPDEQLWVDKTQFLKARQGMALLITHPDYMLERSRLEAYRRFLERWSADDGVWHALPHEVASWWRRRSRLAVAPLEGGAWSVTGDAAADATIYEVEPASRM